MIFDQSKTRNKFYGQIPSYGYSYDLLLTNVRYFESLAHPSGQGSLDSRLRNGSFQGFLAFIFLWNRAAGSYRADYESVCSPIKYRKHSKSAKTFIETN